MSEKDLIFLGTMLLLPRFTSTYDSTSIDDAISISKTVFNKIFTDDE